MSDFSVLESVLRPLSYWYKQDNLEEVAINRAGQIWLRMRGKRAYPWAKPACMKKTKVPQINSQTVFNDVILFSSYLDSLVYGLPFALGSEPGFIKNESTMRVAR